MPFSTPEKQRAWRKKKAATDPAWVERQRAYKKSYHKRTYADPIKRAKHLEREAGYRRKLRLKILLLYGGICECCGETKFEFLAIDHIDGKGHWSLKNIRSRSNYYLWLAKFKRPGFRVLCHNCNQSLGWYGYCPHNKPSAS